MTAWVRMGEFFCEAGERRSSPVIKHVTKTRSVFLLLADIRLFAQKVPYGNLRSGVSGVRPIYL